MDNDGSGININIITGTEAAIDLPLLPDSLAGVCSWEVIRWTTKGSDNHHVVIEEGLRLEEYDTVQAD